MAHTRTLKDWNESERYKKVAAEIITRNSLCLNSEFVLKAWKRRNEKRCKTKVECETFYFPNQWTTTTHLWNKFFLQTYVLTYQGTVAFESFPILHESLPHEYYKSIYEVCVCILMISSVHVIWVWRRKTIKFQLFE